MASGTGFPLVLSSFSLKYISLSTDWIAGLNVDVTEESPFVGPASLPRSNAAIAYHSLFNHFCLYCLKRKSVCCLILKF